MDDVTLGSAFRVVRIRKRWRQVDVARAAHVDQWDVSRLERGQLKDLMLGSVRRIAATLEMTIELTVKWRGPELARLANAAHAALQGALLRFVGSFEGWTVLPEESFSIYGERGAIDILAWHEATRTLLIIELKTLLVEAAALTRTMNQRTRLARTIAEARGWRPAHVATWVILTDTRTNRRDVAKHKEILAPLTGLDGRRMRAWLRAPDGSIRALSFWAEPDAKVARRVRAKRTQADTQSATNGAA